MDIKQKTQHQLPEIKKKIVANALVNIRNRKLDDQKKKEKIEFSMPQETYNAK